MDGVLIRFPLGVSLEFVAELSRHNRVVCLPHQRLAAVVSDWPSMILRTELAAVVLQYCLCTPALENVAHEVFTDAGVDLDQVIFVLETTDSYWTRDYVREILLAALLLCRFMVPKEVIPNLMADCWNASGAMVDRNDGR